MECCLRKLFLPQSFFKRWPLKETFESFLKETFSMKLFTSDCSTHIAVGRDVGLWGWGNDGGGEDGGEGGWGEAFIEVLNKTGIVTHLGCRNKRYDTKSYTKSRGILVLGESPCNDITFSKIRHNLAQKKSENEKARDFT